MLRRALISDVECGVDPSGRGGGGGVHLHPTGGDLHPGGRRLLPPQHEPHTEEKPQEIRTEIRN